MYDFGVSKILKVQVPPAGVWDLGLRAICVEAMQQRAHGTQHRAPGTRHTALQQSTLPLLPLLHFSSEDRCSLLKNSPESRRKKVFGLPNRNKRNPGVLRTTFIRKYINHLIGCTHSWRTVRARVQARTLFTRSLVLTYPLPNAYIYWSRGYTRKTRIGTYE